MTPPKSPCQRGLFFLHLYLPSHRTRFVLRLLSFHGNLKHRCDPVIPGDSDGLRRLCTPMGPNIILRRHSHHQPPLSCPLYWHRPSSVNLGWLFGRQCYPNSILLLSFHSPLYYCRRKHNASSIPSPNRVI